MMQDSGLVAVTAELWADDAVDRAVTVQDILLVALGLRPASLVILPRGLPDAEQLGAEIDRVYDHVMERGHMPATAALLRPAERALRWLTRRTTSDLRYRTSLAREAFRKVMGGAPGYTALRDWARRLGLERVESAVRPTIDEMYLLADETAVSRIEELFALRRQIRVESAAASRQGEAASLRAFPEERDVRFLESLGRLLGYPTCCVRRYATERVAGINVEERAADQIQQALAQGTVQQAAYFTRDFFPCHPDCPQASAKGRAGLSLLDSLGRQAGVTELRDAYQGLLSGNQKTVLRYPEIIRAHQKAMASRRSIRQESGRQRRSDY